MTQWITQHWRGHLPLSRTLWLNTVALMIVMIMIPGLSALGGWTGTADSRNDLWTLVVASLVLTGLIPAWQIVGLWRSADFHIENKGTVLAGRCTQIIATALTVFAITRALGALTEIATIAPIAFNTGIYKSEIRLSSGNRELLLSGGMGLGTAKRVRQTLQKNPQVRRIQLEMWGGSLTEAIELGELIRSHQLQTYTSQFCARECIVPFVAGAHRYLRRGGRLEFSHAQQLPFRLESFFLETGLSKNFVSRWQSTRGRSWLPQEAVLLSSGVVDTMLGQPVR
ncbi:MAG: hypothetical protein OEU86_09820 [Gammaproteobacteria bacterium]|nr:hypothetical protein [Gammaproteobacteria bacterium]